MKCMICGGQTLPGAKLCLPCRAALRRARDDTISELLPLPRRREVFAFSHSPDIGRASSLAPAARPATARSGAGSRSRRLSSAQLHAAAVVAFVAAAGVLTFIMARELQRERAPAGLTEASVHATEPKGIAQRVSPSTMLGNAREESRSGVPAGSDAPNVPIVLPALVEPRSERPSKPKAAAAKPAPAPELPAASVPVEPPVVVVTAALPPPASVVQAAQADRAQLLAAALAKCTGDFFSRFGCEHRTRTQHCDGQWGRIPQCPAGVSNEHGQ